jgi:hypothetical protein
MNQFWTYEQIINLKEFENVKFFKKASKSDFFWNIKKLKSEQIWKTWNFEKMDKENKTRNRNQNTKTDQRKRQKTE